MTLGASEGAMVSGLSVGSSYLWTGEKGPSEGVLSGLPSDVGS